MWMYNLTKENFWNEMNEKYPEAMKVFCKWVDDYKSKNDWEELFNGGVISKLGQIDKKRIQVNRTQSPKYHDLPLALQVGMFIEFVSDTVKDNGEMFNFLVMPFQVISWRDQVEAYIKKIEFIKNN